MIALLAQAGAAFDWAHEFRPFTAFHWVTSGVCFAAIAVSSFAGARWRGTPAERRLRVSWIWAVLVVQVLSLIFFMRPPVDWTIALPFHICDLAGWVAFVALLTGRRWARSLLYYWGIVLSTQAFLTPILRGPGSGYAHAYFWVFWGQHLTIVGSAVYDVVVGRFRPTWRDFVIATGLSTFWTACMFVLNRFIGANYLFVGPTRPENPTLIDKLGDYPLRVLWLGLIVTAGFAVFTVVWPSARKRPLPARAAPAGA